MIAGTIVAFMSILSVDDKPKDVYYASVIICSVQDQHCVKLQDQYGPYDTLDNCEYRAEELFVVGPKIAKKSGHFSPDVKAHSKECRLNSFDGEVVKNKAL